MPRPKSTPSYCVHRRSGRAFVTIDGRQIPLGKADTPESRAAYDRVVGQWFVNGRKLPPDLAAAGLPPPAGPTVAVVVDAFWTHAQAYYTQPERDAGGNPVPNPDGSPRLAPSRELDCYRQALRPLLRMFGGTQAAAFGCPELEAVREWMIRPHADPATGRTESGWCRTYANRQTGRIKHVFGWAVTKNLVPAAVHEALLRLPGLRAGKSAARESDPVRPVDEARALAIVPHVSRQVGAMIQVQLFTGMRSTEVCILRPRDIDRTVTPWVYTPMFHKTEGHDVARKVPVGPRARAVLAPFLEGRDADAFLFSPREADAEWREELRKEREERQVKLTPSRAERFRRSARRVRRKAPGKRYTAESYYKAVMWGCEVAFGMPKEYRPAAGDYAAGGDPPDVVKAKADRRRAVWANRSAWHAANAWHPHQVRHRTATDLRKAGGLEVSQVVLGHTSKRTTEIYAEADVGRAHEAVERIG